MTFMSVKCIDPRITAPDDGAFYRGHRFTISVGPETAQFGAHARD
jgi:hypothetical protein